MSLFRTILFVAALAGIGSGVVVAGIHLVAAVPLILQAETYEAAGEAAPHTHDAAPAPTHDTAAPAHDHGDEGWSPADGLERNGLTVIFMVLTGFGYALLLVAASELAGGLRDWRHGLFWGLAGFAAFTLAPNLGLPPELPAMPAADLAARQLWWAGTAAATAAGIALMVLPRSALFAALGVVLILVPHVIGAPQPDSFESPIPEGLYHSFVVASVASSFVFWVLLGALAGALRPRFAAEADAVPAARAA
ncbi:CbtA family protein [Ancylobacter terrae]|uniref:CbtA family protein n=1 Tax=Ancylobacter sp. sgz301288 TaxID=3342077 RepID=UPI00385EA518